MWAVVQAKTLIKDIVNINSLELIFHKIGSTTPPTRLIKPKLLDRLSSHLNTFFLPKKSLRFSNYSLRWNVYSGAIVWSIILWTFQHKKILRICLYWKWRRHFDDTDDDDVDIVAFGSEKVFQTNFLHSWTELENSGLPSYLTKKKEFPML